MKTGIFIAVLLHVAVLLFGGLIFNTHKDEKREVRVVDLVDPEVTPDKNKETPKDETPPDKIEEAKDVPPDAAEIVRSLEQPSAAPALAEMSLGDLSAALNGSGGGADFGQALDTASGGVVGGTGRAGALKDAAEQTFSAAEIDQKPRAVFQASPVFPAELRGKNIDGTVVVIFIVTPDGKVISQKAESSNNPAFEKPALEAVKQWKFEPGLRAGQRVATRMRVTIRFQRS